MDQVMINFWLIVGIPMVLWLNWTFARDDYPTEESQRREAWEIAYQPNEPEAGG